MTINVIDVPLFLRHFIRWRNQLLFVLVAVAKKSPNTYYGHKAKKEILLPIE